MPARCVHRTAENLYLEAGLSNVIQRVELEGSRKIEILFKSISFGVDRKKHQQEHELRLKTQCWWQRKICQHERFHAEGASYMRLKAVGATLQTNT